MNTPLPAKAIVSALIEKTIDGIRHVYLQTRWKQQSSPTYSGLLEIPAGGIEGYENIVEALKREVLEETGLNVVRIIGGFEGKAEENIAGSKTIVFQPFVCQQTLQSDNGLPWIGFVFRCEVEGTVSINSQEAKDPQWITIEELKALLVNKPQLFFPLQFPVLRYYAEKNVSVSEASSADQR